MPRLICTDELDQLLTLYRVLHPDDPVVRDSLALRSLWEGMMSDPSLFVIVHEEEDEGELVSSCTLAVVKNLTRGCRPYGVVEKVITLPSYRRRGYGTLVLGEALRIAREQGCYKVLLSTGAKDEDTLRFYEQAGFSRGIKTGFVALL